MFFRALTLFRFPSIFHGIWPTHCNDEFGALALHDAFAELALKPVGPLELQSRGFVPPFGQPEEGVAPTYTHRVGDCIWLTLGGEDRVIPAAAVNEALRKKIAQVEHDAGKKLGGRARKQLKGDLIIDMLPKAFIKPCRVNAYIDLKRRFLAVDTTSRKVAEQVVSHIRQATGSFPALPLAAEKDVPIGLSGWLSMQPNITKGVALGDEAEMRDRSENGEVVKFQRADLSSDEIQQQLETGKHCTRLALNYNGHVSFVLDEGLVIRKLKILDGALESIESLETESIAAELDARFALMTGEIGQLLDMLHTAFAFDDPDNA